MKPSLLEQGQAIVAEQTTNSAAASASVDRESAEATASVKAGGDKWSVYAWARWAKDRLTGRSDRAAGVGGEFRWFRRP